MFEKIKDFFNRAWKWIESVWEKHDDMLEEMVAAILPMVIEVTFRSDLDGDEKRKAIVDAIVDNAEVASNAISRSLLNEAVEVAANRYNIQIGTQTVEKMDAALNAATKASRDFTNKKLKIAGTEAEALGITPLVLGTEDVE